jgi:hypothetical protein
MSAGIPCRELAAGGRDWGKWFLLDEHDRLNNRND